MIQKILNKTGFYLTGKLLNGTMNKYSINYINIRLTTRRYVYHTSTEGENIHNILLSLPSYFDTTINSQKLKKCQAQFLDNPVAKPSLALSRDSLSNGLSNTEAYIQELKNRFASNISKCSDDELIKTLLMLVTLSPIEINKNSRLLFKILSEECTKRSHNFTIDQILLFADIWYNISIGLPIHFRYFDLAVKKLFLKVHSLNTYQFTQSFFYLRLCPNYKFDVKQNIIEKKIEYALNYIGVEELAIISLGIFRSSNHVYNIGILNNFVKMITENKKDISNFTLVAVLKFLKTNLLGSHADHNKLCLTVLAEFQSEVNRLNNFSLTHLVSLGSNLGLYNEKLLSSLFDHFAENIHSVRLKELERFASVLLNINPKKSALIWDLIESELMSSEREREIHRYYVSLLSCVYYITCLGRYNHHLISKALELNEFVSTSGDIERFRHLFELDQIVQIEELKNYQGHRLSKDFLNKISKKCLMRIPSWTNSEISSREKQFLEVNDIISQVLNEKFTKIAYTLPFSSMPDVLFCTDRLGNLTEFPHEKFNYLPGAVKYKPESELTWHALVILNTASYNRNSNTTRGVVDRNIRLIRKLGYNVIIVDKRMIDKEASEDPAQYLFKLLNKNVNKAWLLNLKKNRTITKVLN